MASLPNNVDVRRRYIIATGGSGYGGESGASNGTLQGGTASFQVGILSQCTDISMIFNNAYGSQPETLGANPILVRAGLLLQSDSTTVYPLFFKGSRTAIIEPGGSIESDPTPITLYPPVMYVRTFVQPIGTYEVDSVGLGAATAGTFTLSFVWQSVTYTTASIAYNASNVAVQAAIVAATGGAGQVLAAGTVTVTGGPLPAAITITFSGAMYGPVTSQTITPSGLTGGTATFTRTTNGVFPGTYPGTYAHESQTAGGKALNAGSAMSCTNNYATNPGPDLTFSNSTTGFTTPASYTYQPEAIIGSGPSLTPSILIIGDSIAQGFGDVTGNGAGTWTAGFIIRAINETHPYVRMEAYGDLFRNSGEVNNVYGRDAPIKYGHYAICEYGVNDIYALGDTLAQVQASAILVWSKLARRGVKTYQTTLTPETTSTDSWATSGNQTPTTGNTVRIGFNDWVRQGAPMLIASAGALPTATTNGTTNAVYARQPGHPLVGYFEIADIAETSRDSGIWVTNGTANYPTTDGIHPSTAMAILMSAGINMTVFI
jgi:lysophospholipase L1-like esterase